MTQKELSRLEVRINIRVLWAIVASIVIGTAAVVKMYSDVKTDIVLIKYQIEELKTKK